MLIEAQNMKKKIKAEKKEKNKTAGRKKLDFNIKEYSNSVLNERNDKSNFSIKKPTLMKKTKTRRLK
jgi:hypothetical protein